MRKNYYDTFYFEQRDHVDIHMAQAIRLLMKKHKLKKVLDVGCGTGRLVQWLQQHNFQAYGCDTAEKAVKIAKKITNNKVVKGSAQKLPFKTNSFDLITCISVVEHLTQKQVDMFLKEARRVLKKDGLIFLVTPNYATPLRYIQKEKWFGYSDPTHINFYTPTSLKSILKNHSFQNIQLYFETTYDSPFDWDLPGFLRKLPKPLKTAITYLLIATPLLYIRNSFWIAGQKTKNEKN